MRRNHRLLVALPTVFGFLLWQAFRFGWLADSILYLRANLGLLLFLRSVTFDSAWLWAFSFPPF